jgi:ribonuclease VapC
MRSDPERRVEPAPEYVLDASALLALLHQEAGADHVRLVVRRSTISPLNWSEVVQKTLSAGLALEDRRDELLAVGLSILPFDREDAELTAALWSKASHLSLADRACLALAWRNS